MTTVRLRAWEADDLALLHVGNTPAMTEHLGGPESDPDLQKRHHRYLDATGAGGTPRMFAVLAGDQAVGAIGWWPTRWRERDVAETGWFVAPEAQGRGVARAAVSLVIEDALVFGSSSSMLAFPAVANVASNRLCEIAGFTLSGAEEFPFRGSVLQVNAWVLDLDELRAQSPGGAGVGV